MNKQIRDLLWQDRNKDLREVEIDLWQNKMKEIRKLEFELWRVRSREFAAAMREMQRQPSSPQTESGVRILYDCLSRLIRRGV